MVLVSAEDRVIGIAHLNAMSCGHLYVSMSEVARSGLYAIAGLTDAKGL